MSAATRHRVYARPPKCSTCLDTGAVLVKGTTVRIGCPVEHQPRPTASQLVIDVLDSMAGRFVACVLLTIFAAAALSVLA